MPGFPLGVAYTIDLAPYNADWLVSPQETSREDLLRLLLHPIHFQKLGQINDHEALRSRLELLVCSRGCFDHQGLQGSSSTSEQTLLFMRAKFRKLMP